MYNWEDYIDIAEQFIKDKNYKNKDFEMYKFSGDKVVSYCDKRGKTLIDLDSFDVQDLLINGLGIKNIGTFNAYVTIYTNFYDWLIKRGIIDVNPIDGMGLTTKIFTEQLAHDINYFSTDDINDMGRVLKNKTDNGEFYELLIRLFYEGVVANVGELYDLRKSQYKNGFVLKGERLKQISNRLKYLIETIPDRRVFVRNRIDGRIRFYGMRYPYDDAMFAVPERTSIKKDDIPPKILTDNADRPATIKLLERQTKLACEYGLDYTYRGFTSDLYKCGFIEFCIAKCGTEETINMFLSNDRSDKMAQLVSYAKEYCLVVPLQAIRFRHKPYILALQRICEDK